MAPHVQHAQYKCTSVLVPQVHRTPYGMYNKAKRNAHTPPQAKHLLQYGVRGVGVLYSVSSHTCSTCFPPVAHLQYIHPTPALHLPHASPHPPLPKVRLNNMRICIFLYYFLQYFTHLKYVQSMYIVNILLIIIKFVLQLLTSLI